ncbi:(R)-mandelonitrile lyase [Mangrovibrevibacter kandeliae]|uniref:(R)-mandelonitrile lyase n=1 Tax=Mangrovibrevibacter kandeliae TaxID=2968473 RepID=UPI002118A396|nr:cupin domain-containing protein [Aurantimonas sp. CSK15Z-1]MCQ8784079.1 cupin domain-containing protein [Aurantimonas sp. CSK15Z-1]
MTITRCGETPTVRASADWFTGEVLRTAINDAPAPARVQSALVQFAPGARTNWHTHPLGQTLYVTSGCGRVQFWGGPVETIRAGDTVWIPPGEKHWHGAGPKTAMSHVAIQESDGGRAIDWLEPVTDAQYAAG